MPLRCQQWRVLSLLLSGRPLDPASPDDAAGAPAELLGAESGRDGAGIGGKNAAAAAAHADAGRSPLFPPPVVLTLRGPDALERALDSRAVRRLRPNVIYVCAGVLRPRSSVGGGGGQAAAGIQTTPLVAPLPAGTVEGLEALLASFASSAAAAVDFLYLDAPCERADVERLRRGGNGNGKEGGGKGAVRVRHALFWPAAGDALPGALPPLPSSRNRSRSRSPSPSRSRSALPALACPPVPASCASLLGHAVFAAMRPRAASVPEAVAVALCCLQASSDAGGPAPRSRGAKKAASGALAAAAAAGASPGGTAAAAAAAAGKKPPVFVIKIPQPGEGDAQQRWQQQRRSPTPPPLANAAAAAADYVPHSPLAFPDSPQARARLGLPCFSSDHAPALPSIDSVAVPVAEVLEALFSSEEENEAEAAPAASARARAHLALALARSLASLGELGRCLPGAEVPVVVPPPPPHVSSPPPSPGALLEALVRGYRSLRVLSRPEAVVQKSSESGGGGGETRRGIDVSVATGSRQISLRRLGMLGEALRAALSVAGREACVASVAVVDSDDSDSDDDGEAAAAALREARAALLLPGSAPSEEEQEPAAAAAAAAVVVVSAAAASLALAKCSVRTRDGFEGPLTVVGDRAFLLAAASACAPAPAAAASFRAKGRGGGGGGAGGSGKSASAAPSSSSLLLPPSACLPLLDFAVRQALVADALCRTQMRCPPRSAIPLIAPPPGSAAGSAEEFGRRKRRDRRKEKESSSGGRRLRRQRRQRRGQSEGDERGGGEESGEEEEGDGDDPANSESETVATAGAGGEENDDDDDDDGGDGDDVPGFFERPKSVGLRPSGVLVSRWGAAYLRFAAAAPAAAPAAAAGSSSSGSSGSVPLSPPLALAALAAVDGAAVRGFSSWHAALFRALGSEPAPVMPTGWQQPSGASAPKTPPPFGGEEEDEEEEEGGGRKEVDSDEEEEEEAGAAAGRRSGRRSGGRGASPPPPPPALDLCLNGVPLDASVLEEAARAAGGAAALLPKSHRRRKRRGASAASETDTEGGGGGEEEENDNDVDDETASLWARRVLPLLPGAGCAARDPVADGRALARVYVGLLAEKKSKNKK